MFALTFAMVVLGIGPSARDQSEGSPTPGQVREAVERSLPFLEDEGVGWMQIQRCNSCHRVPFLLWSHHEAMARGIALDHARLDEWTRWALADTFEDRRWFRLRPRSLAALRSVGVPESVVDKLAPAVDTLYLKEGELLAGLGKVLAADERERHKGALVKAAALPNNGGGPDTLSQLILARAPLEVDPGMRASYDDVRSLLLQWQEPEGHWVGQGQQPDQRRPRAEMNACTTMWAILALGAIERPGDATAASRARALDWLKGVRPGVSTESLVLRALVERRFGDPGQADAWLAELRREQKPDGGWSWVRRVEASDAFATGEVLYALGGLGLGGDDAAVRRAWSYLLRTQGEDGAWDVPASPITTKTGEALAKMKDGYNFWGTAWAAIGLSRTLPPLADDR